MAHLRVCQPRACLMGSCLTQRFLCRVALCCGNRSAPGAVVGIWVPGATLLHTNWEVEGSHLTSSLRPEDNTTLFSGGDEANTAASGTLLFTHREHRVEEGLRAPRASPTAPGGGSSTRASRASAPWGRFPVNQGTRVCRACRPEPGKPVLASQNRVRGKQTPPCLVGAPSAWFPRRPGPSGLNAAFAAETRGGWRSPARSGPRRGRHGSRPDQLRGAPLAATRPQEADPEPCLSFWRDLEDFSLLPAVLKLHGITEGASVAPGTEESLPRGQEPAAARRGAAHGVGRGLALWVRPVLPGSCASCAWESIRGAGRHGAPEESRRSRVEVSPGRALFSFVCWWF